MQHLFNSSINDNISFKNMMKEIIDNIELSLLNVGYANHDADWNFGPVCGAVTRIYWATEGAATVTIDGDVHTITPDHLYMIPAFVSHYENCDGIFRHYYLHIADTSQHIVQLFDQYELPFEVPILESDKLIFQRLMSLCPKMGLLRSTPDTYETSSCFLQYSQRFSALPLGPKMEIKGLMTLLMSRFFTAGHIGTNVSDERIVKIQRIIERDLKSVPSIDEMASEISLCKDRFIRLFHQETGLTPTNYIIRKKVLRAQILLSTKNILIKQIASDLGFSNVSYFGRVFNKVTGMSPIEFKRQNK